MDFQREYRAGVALSRDESNAATLDVGERAEAVVFNFEEPVRVGKCL